MYFTNNSFISSLSIRVIIGKTIEKAWGIPSKRLKIFFYIKGYLIAPAGLTHTFYLPTNPQIADLARGYTRFDGKHWKTLGCRTPL
jgi:hypothetical protein